MTDSVAADMLQSLVCRIESIDDELQALNSDKSEVYKEAKSAGFDVKVMRKLISDRRKDVSERAEFETIYDLYAEALGMYRSTGERSVRTHVENTEEFPAHDAETGEITEPQTAPPAAQMPAVTAESPSTNGHATSLDRAEGIADGQPIQPETADHEGEAQKVERRSPKPEAAGSIPATFANTPETEAPYVPTPMPGIDAFAGSSNGRTADFDSVNAGSTPAPASKFDARSLRPHCRQPFACGGSGPKHCWKCEQAAAEKASAA